MSGPAVVELEDIAARVPDGARLALPADYSGCAMAAVGALIARGARRLRLVGVPTLGLQADWLIGAGCVAGVEAAAMTLGEHGLPPRFAAALAAGRLDMQDSTCPVIHAGLQAAEKGIPFMPMRGLLGSDLVAHRPEWRVVADPYSEDGAPIVLVPAIRPDIALFHARAADRDGNVFIGVRRELMAMAHAAAATLVTVEEIADRDFLADEAMAAGTIPALYVSALAVVVNGAWPIGLAGAYPPDRDALAGYVRAARTEAGFEEWLAAHVAAAAAS